MANEPDVSENGTGPASSSGPSGRGAGRSTPTGPQRAYLARGLDQPGGKLPLFDRSGREIPQKTVKSCLQRGWAEPWFDNPTKPDWLVCKLTAAGYRALGASPPETGGEEG